MKDAYVYDAVRTPRGKGKKTGALHEVPPVDLAATVLRAVRERNDVAAGGIDEVVLGCVEPVMEQGSDIARTAALCAGYADSVPGMQIHRFCSSALDAVNLVAAQVCAGQLELAIGGGVESMSRVPMFSSGSAWATDPKYAFDIGAIPQGVAADLMATRYGYARSAVDAYACETQRRAAEAMAGGRLDRSIVPVKDEHGITLLAKDEHPRPGVTPESLATLKPAFQEQGEMFGFGTLAQLDFPDVERVEYVHHPGNSSGIVDGASAVLVGSEEAGHVLGVRPRAKVRSWASVGTEPTLMFRGPGPASEKALRLAGMAVSDVDLFEMNEAFAVMPLWFRDHFDIDPERLNVNGGAIAYGHPLGATGAMLLGTVLDELEQRDLSVGLVSLCVASGMGTTTIIERV